MQMVLLTIQIIIAILLVAIILLQKSSSDGLSGLGAGGNRGLVSGKTATNILTKTTMVLAALFMINSLWLANLTAKASKNSSIIDQVNKNDDKHHHHKKHHNKNEKQEVKQ